VKSRPYAACLLAASLTVGGTALAGCSGDGDPPATSTTSSSTSSSSSTTTTPSSTTTSTTTSPVKLPPEATKHTEKGAEAFVEFYLEQVNRAWTTPKAGVLPQLSESECISCKSFEKEAKDLVAKGHRYASDPATYKSFTAFGGAPKGRQYVRVIGTQHRVNIVDDKGKVVSTDPQKPIAVNAMTIWNGGRWLLYDMG
jgi:hypothetical protein